MWQSCLFRVLLPNQAAASHVLWGSEVPWNYTSDTGIALWCSVLSSSHELLEKSHQKRSEEAWKPGQKYSGKQSEQDYVGAHLRPCWVVGWLILPFGCHSHTVLLKLFLQTTLAKHKAVLS